MQGRTSGVPAMSVENNYHNKTLNGRQYHTIALPESFSEQFSATRIVVNKLR